MSTLREAAEKALALADEYARAAAKAYTESLYGTSKSYTAECVKDEAACRESLRAALAAPAPAAAPDETIDGKRIEEEAQHFFEWPDPKRRDTVTLTSCVIFAAKIAEMVRAELAKPDAPDGWQVVPVELTPEMLDAMQSSAWLPICYRAMLAAAPVAPTAQPQAQPAQEAPYLLVGLVDCGECRTQGCQGVCRNARAHAPSPTSATVSEPVQRSNES